MVSITQIIVLLLVGILLFGNIRKIVEQVMDSINAIKRWQSKQAKTDEEPSATNLPSDSKNGSSKALHDTDKQVSDKEKH